MTLEIFNRQRTKKINTRLLKQIVGDLFAESKIEQANLGIHLVAAPEMTRLNEKFLRHAGPTDVITFDYSNPRSQAPDPRRQLHGEIFVCVDEAVLQARKFGTSWQSEVVRYIVHGVLHLLNFDDVSVGVRRKMKRAEDRRLRAIACRFPLSKL